VMELFLGMDLTGAIGAVCRNDLGVFVAANATVCPMVDAEILEAMACLEAFALAEDRGIRKLKVASDCLSVIKNIRDNCRCSYMMILQDIQERTKLFDCTVRAQR
jgi:hypothetical protein